VARTVTLFRLGTLAGAVNSPVASIVPQVVTPAAQVTLQVTAEFDVPPTVAVNVCVSPERTLAAAGDVVTVITGVAEVLFPTVLAQPATNPASANEEKTSARRIRVPNTVPP
jgi:hypothetical protein